MCGISGTYNYLNKPINIKGIVEKIVKLQHLRGPDDQGVWESNCKRLCLGHNRLTIIDLSEKGRQPFVSNDKSCVITFNGEIYNYKEIKNELTNKNIIFKSNTDTEVLIESYKYWGLDFLKKLRGMFAFAMWDSIKKKLILSRDPFGIKPLYYSKKNGLIYFASQVKSLLSIENINSSYSEAGIVSYHLWGHIQDPLTLYKDISSVDKGSCLIINENGDEEKYIYADIKEKIINSKALEFKDEKEKIIYLKEAVDETVNYHQVSDVPLTILLSSGVDSNSILASIKEKDKKNVSALTIDFNFKGSNNEIPLAKQSALMNNILHYIEEIPSNEFFPLIETFLQKMDLPTNDGFNNFLVSYLAKKKNSKIIVSGIGGDEIFLGYPSFKLIPKINKILTFFPKSNFLNSFFKKAIYPLLKKSFLKTKYAGIYEYGKDKGSAFFLFRSLFLPFEMKNMLSPEILKRGLEELNIMKTIEKDIEGISDKRLAIMYLEMKYYLCSKLLRDADWTSMCHSVELRTPFVDWTFFTKIIPLIKSSNDFSKKNLLNCVKSKVPNELFKREKTGFNIPHNYYLKTLSVNRKFFNPIRDWSTYIYKKYTNDIKFSIYSLGRAWTFQLANSFKKSKNLDSLITGYPKIFTRKYGIPNKFVKSFFTLLVLQRLFIKLNIIFNKLNFIWRYQIILDWITDFVYSLSNIKESNFLILGFGNTAYRIFKKAKANRVKTIYFLNTNNETFKEKILLAESSKIGIKDFYKFHKPSKIEKERLNKSIEMADYVGTISSFHKKTFVEEGFDESKIFVNLPGVDTKIFSPKNITKNKFIVLTVSNDFINKGTRYLVDAYNSLELDNSELWILGSSEKRLAEKIVNLKKNNIFLNSVDEFKLPDFYNQARIFCLPTLNDSGPLVILQAMACALPIITTKYSIAPDLIKDGQEGFIIEPSDVKTISEKIKFLYDNPNIALRIGEKARKKIEENFTWDLASKRILNFCTEKLDQHKF